jgi:hypothetical protein
MKILMIIDVRSGFELISSWGRYRYANLIGMKIWNVGIELGVNYVIYAKNSDRWVHCSSQLKSGS